MADHGRLARRLSIQSAIGGHIFIGHLESRGRTGLHRHTAGLEQSSGYRLVLHTEQVWAGAFLGYQLVPEDILLDAFIIIMGN